MSDYEMNWQSDMYREKYELLNARVQEFERFINDPTLLSFHIINQVVRTKFDELFALPARD